MFIRCAVDLAELIATGNDSFGPLQWCLYHPTFLMSFHDVV